MVTELTFEHVPPSAAFNDRPIVRGGFERLIALDSLDDVDSIRGPTQQRGAGAYTLCSWCNNTTGAWYGRAYVDWAYQGLTAVSHARNAPSLYFVFRVFPLRVIKQILCMFFSANPPSFQAKQTDTVRLLLNRWQKHLHPSVRLYGALNWSDRARQSAITGRAHFDTGKTYVYSEIAFRPFTYVLTLDSPPPDDRLVDLSHFATYAYNDWCDVALRLPILSVYTFFPGDFRDRAEAASEARAVTERQPENE